MNIGERDAQYAFDPQQPVAFYHPLEDAPDVVTPPPLANVMKLALAWIASNEIRRVP